MRRRRSSSTGQSYPPPARRGSGNRARGASRCAVLLFPPGANRGRGCLHDTRFRHPRGAAHARRRARRRRGRRSLRASHARGRERAAAPPGGRGRPAPGGPAGERARLLRGHARGRGGVAGRARGGRGAVLRLRARGAAGPGRLLAAHVLRGGPGRARARADRAPGGRDAAPGVRDHAVRGRLLRSRRPRPPRARLPVGPEGPADARRGAPPAGQRPPGALGHGARRCPSTRWTWPTRCILSMASCSTAWAPGHRRARRVRGRVARVLGVGGARAGRGRAIPARRSARADAQGATLAAALHSPSEAGIELTVALVRDVPGDDPRRGLRRPDPGDPAALPGRRPGGRCWACPRGGA
jgi:hypothetical protein